MFSDTINGDWSLKSANCITFDGIPPKAKIVGYSTVTVQGRKKVPFALQFDSVSNPGNPVKIDKLITYGESGGKTSGSFTEAVDQIHVWSTTENTWRKYGYHKPSGQDARWERIDTSVQPYVWYALTDDDVVYPGQTFIFHNGKSSTASSDLTFSGQVVQLTEKPYYDIPPRKKMFVAFPWPVEKKIAQLGNSYAEGYEGKSSGSFTEAVDQIWFWSTSDNTWRKYGFHKPSGQDARWERIDTTVTPYVWYALTDDDVVPAGQGFIFHNGQSTSSGKTVRLQFSMD